MRNFKLNSAAFTSSNRMLNASGGFEEVESQPSVNFEQSMVSIKKCLDPPSPILVY